MGAQPIAIPSLTVDASPVDRSFASRTDLSPTDLAHVGRSDLGSLLEIVPGMNVRSGGRAEPRLDVRGFDQRATLLTLDGVPLYDAFNGVLPVALVPSEMLGAVTVTRGATSTLYGPSGMAGAIHLASRERDIADLRATTTWRASKFWDARTSIGGSHGRTAAFAGTRVVKSDGFPLSNDFERRAPSRRRFENGGVRRNSDREDWSIFARGNHALRSGAEISGMYVESNSTYGIPPRSTSFTPQFRRIDDQVLRHGHVALDSHAAAGLGIGMAVFYSGYDAEESERLGREHGRVLARVRSDAHDVGALARSSFELGQRRVLAVAGQYRHAWAFIADSAAGTRARPEVETGTMGIEGEQQFGDAIAAVAGLSGDVQAGGGRGAAFEANPQAGLRFDFGGWGVSRTSVARKTRFPTLRELFDPIQGNPHLRPETAWVVEVGHGLRLPGNLAGDLVIFRADVDGLIESSGGRQGDPAPARNIAEAILQGGEVALDWSPHDALRVRANYTLLDAKAANRLSLQPEIRNELQHRPRHRANAIVDSALPLGLLGRAEVQYTSTQVDRFGTSVRLEDSLLLHAQLTKMLFDDRVGITVGADNLLDEDYEEALGMPQPGRWLYVAVRLELS